MPEYLFHSHDLSFRHSLSVGPTYYRVFNSWIERIYLAFMIPTTCALFNRTLPPYLLKALEFLRYVCCLVRDILRYLIRYILPLVGSRAS